MTILMNCPECGLPQEHEILAVHEDEDGYTNGYMITCRFCEHVWDEWLR